MISLEEQAKRIHADLASLRGDCQELLDEISPDKGVSPYLLRPCRTLEQAQRDRLVLASEAALMAWRELTVTLKLPCD